MIVFLWFVSEFTGWVVPWSDAGQTANHVGKLLQHFIL